MSGLFLILLAVHTLHSLTLYRNTDSKSLTRNRKTAMMLLQLALFVLAVSFGLAAETFDRSLVSPVFIVLGIALGHLIFGVSLLVTHRSVEDASEHFFSVNAVCNFLIEHPYVLSRFIFVGVSEEIIWRAAAQPILVKLFVGPLGGPAGMALGILVIAVAFSIVHEHFFKNSWIVSLEFLGFALLLGALFAWTQSLILVILIHTVRDLEISYLEYLVKVHEYGDEKKAAQEVEATYFRPMRGTHE